MQDYHLDRLSPSLGDESGIIGASLDASHISAHMHTFSVLACSCYGTAAGSLVSLPD